MEGALAYVGERAIEVILEEGRADTGGDLILSNFARGRVKMSAESTISGTTLTLKAVPPGPWMLIEAGSHKAEWWEPRKSRKGKLRFADGNVRNYVRHGAVRARNTFTRASRRINADASGWMTDYVNQLIGRAA
jgi:hypothetical protein